MNTGDIPATITVQAVISYIFHGLNYHRKLTLCSDKMT